MLTQLKQNDSKDNPQVQALNTLVAQTDSYNWGYDPFHYTVPEGSYATDPEGTARIKEFRTMIQAIKQDLGMNVIWTWCTTTPTPRPDRSHLGTG
ncbi:pullulanase [Klebsiella pneumoniae]|uniref:Pullulanase n=1 Tax=Klebsiella pneumoniae TaxID=573 RepID=A0A2X3GR93_KLEPN|nr:pullulanase [Klebsiella pneumoniae]